MEGYFLHYLLFSLCMFLGFCAYGRKTGDLIEDWCGGMWLCILCCSFIPIFGTVFLAFAYVGPALLKERTLKKTYEKDSMLKGDEDVKPYESIGYE